MKGVSGAGPGTESWAFEIHFEFRSLWVQTGGKGPWWWWVGCRLDSGLWQVGHLEGSSLSSSSPPHRMILSVLTGLLFGSDGYYVALAWTSSALMYFLVSLGCPLPLFPWGWSLPSGPASALSFLPGTLFANSSPGSRQHGGLSPPATSPALPDSGSCSLPAPHHILADLPPGPVTPGPHWH